jgi:glycosyltransferase involved in cell wall biosynthesis
VVIPACNEEGAIQKVVESWDQRLGALGIEYELRVYDDGSKDDTGNVLEALARQRPRLVPVRQTNRGHGPTILRGYREARGEWIFQVDGDDELPADAFPAFWQGREAMDVVQGYRTDRRSPVSRRLLSAGARAVLRILFGGSVRDANVPYRLYRRSALRELLDSVPEGALTPNIVLSGLTLRRGLRIRELPVPHRPRRTGSPSLARLRIWRFAFRALGQTAVVALRARRLEPGSARA